MQGGFFFCEPCRRAEEYFVKNKKWPGNWSTSRTFKCSASHKRWDFPTHKIKSYYSNPRNASATSNSTSVTSSCPQVTSEEQAALATNSRSEDSDSSDSQSEQVLDEDISVLPNSPKRKRAEDETESVSEEVQHLRESLLEKETECYVHSQDNEVLRSNLKNYSNILLDQIANLKAQINIIELEKQELRNKVLHQAQELKLKEIKLKTQQQQITYSKNKEKKKKNQEVLRKDNDKKYRSYDCETLVRTVLTEFISKYQPRTGARKLGGGHC